MGVTSNNDETRVESKKGGCPIDHTKKTKSSWGWFGSSSSKKEQLLKSVNDSSSEMGGGGCPVKHDGGGGCPVKHNGTTTTTRKSSSPFAIPSLEKAANYSQTPLVDQQIPLSTSRVISSIPRGSTTTKDEEDTSSHSNDNDGSNKWVYPSEQQFYNALRRKGWEGVEETNMPLVVRIHNVVNEKGWSHIKEWESQLHNNTNPKLVKFLGRPQDPSPRAYLKSCLGYDAPFDRHDWYVENNDDNHESGEPRRYVIDFYDVEPSSMMERIVSTLKGKSSEETMSSTAAASRHLPPRPPSMYLDVRPALDSPSDAFDRATMIFIKTFPAIYKAISKQQKQLPPIVTASNNNKNNYFDAKTTMSPQQKTTTTKPSKA